jgi:multidrug efflux system membrane fusion protein
MSRHFLASLACSGILLTSASLVVADDPKSDRPKVDVSHPVEREVPDVVQFVGRTRAPQAEIKSRATGYLMQIVVKEGAEVKKGDLLFEIDPRPYQTEVDLAESKVKLAQAQLDLAKTTLDYYRILKKNTPGAVSQEQIDQYKATVVEAEARLVVEQKTWEIHKLNLDFTKIVSPISGRVGRYAIAVGNLVKADDTVLTTVSADEPLQAQFYMDLSTHTRWELAMSKGNAKAKNPIGYPVTMGLANETEFPREGKVDFTDGVFDPATGELLVSAVFPNDDHALKSGMFVRVRLAISDSRKVLMVAENAVYEEEGKVFVFVVNRQNEVQRRSVKVGPRQKDGLIVVTDGLTADDRVLPTGRNGLEQWATVQPKLVPMPEKAPDDRDK